MTTEIQELVKDTCQTDWLIEDMLPAGHRGMIANVEGGGKTTLLCWIALCIATGKELFGKHVTAGPVLMIDEETPTQSLEKKLYRFCLGLGLENRSNLAHLQVMSKEHFRFARKDTKHMDFIKGFQPKLITIDTLLACLPSGRQGKGENNAETGTAVRDDLSQMLELSPGCSILLAAHSNKPVMNWEIEDYREVEMQALVRGHGSIVGEACDTGYGLLKLSAQPLRLALVTKPRREAIPLEQLFIEMKEQEYGKGWARLEKIPPIPTPPSPVAVDISSIFLMHEDGKPVTAQTIKGKASALYTPGELRQGLEQLRRRKVITPTTDRFTFELNPKDKEIDQKYLDQLLERLGNN